MNSEKLIIMMWSSLMISAGFLTPKSEKHSTRAHNIMQSAGYPKVGDIPTLNRKVFKAQRVTIREHPYVASIRRLCSHYLTGVLTTRNIVLTVAHPLLNVPVREINVVFGENYSDRGTILYTVVLVIIHQDFDQYTLRNDIAMLRVYEHISYKMNIKSILVMASQASIKGKKAFVTGWGRCDNMGTELCLDRTSKYYPDEKIDPMLRSVSFTINTPNYYCAGYKRHEVVLHPGMMCTGVAREEDQVAPCLAAPGAPLVIQARLAGLLSWGFGCGYSYDLPLIYSNITHFLPWIGHNNEVLFKLKQNNLTVLFEATKAAVLAQWLMESRNIKPNVTLRRDRNLEPLPLDYQLSKVQGLVYDVRDFISNGLFSAEKVSMYKMIRSDYKKSLTTTRASKRKPTTPGRPFLSNEVRKEAGL